MAQIPETFDPNITIPFIIFLATSTNKYFIIYSPFSSQITESLQTKGW